VAESFFGTLQLELLDEHRWSSRQGLALAVFDWIGTWHNPRRDGGAHRFAHQARRGELVGSQGGLDLGGTRVYPALPATTAQGGSDLRQGQLPA
jgi:hypothetical protein